MGLNCTAPDDTGTRSPAQAMTIVLVVLAIILALDGG
jgi:hypothetical protein